MLEEARLTPALRTLGTIGLAASAFDLGWKIGTGIRTKLLKIGVPERGSDLGDGCGSRYGVSLQYVPAGYVFPSLGASVSEAGWLWQFSGYSSACGDGPNTRWFNSPCRFSWPTVPPPYELRLTVTPTDQTCPVWPTVWPPRYASINPVAYGFVPEHGTVDALGAAGPVEDYTNQPYDRASAAPPAPAQTDVEQSVDRQLDDAVNDALRQWLNYALGSPGETDPTGAGAPNMPDCRGVSYTTCTAALQERGIQTTVSVLSFEQADLTLPAGAVVSTNPTPGAPVDANTVVEVSRNPDAADMPVAVPEPQTDETVDEYTSRAEAVGFVVNPQPEVDADEDLVADAVTRVAPNDRARPSATIDVFFNPDTPETASNEEPDCRLSTPSGIDPLPSAIDYFAIYQGTTFERTLGPGEAGFPGSTQTALLVGDVRTVDFTKGGFVGFGYRKIKAKHGWSPADAAATAEALMTEPQIQNWGGAPGRAEYRGPQYAGQNGAICERVVVVAFTARPDEPAPRELITSYGKKVG